MDAMDLTGQRVVVMGLGRFGGGIGVTRWLVRSGAKVTVTDRASAEALADSVAQLSDADVTLHLGGHDPADLDDCDLLVVSPAVAKARSEFVQDALARGIPLSSEMNLFIERCPARRVVGVTGSVGKSTTTAMLGAILTSASSAGFLPRVRVGGNIGQSLLDDLAAMEPDDIVVLELSSFQLEDLAALAWSPPLAVITNIQPNHLDRHGTMEAYTEAKLNIVRFQSPDGRVFIHEGEDGLAGEVARVGAGPRTCRYRFDPSFRASLRVPGRHNEDNAAAAVAVARALGLKDDSIGRGLSAFTGLPHRLEFVAEHDGVRYFNDSKSTGPESTLVALAAFREPTIVLVGGRSKGASFENLGRQLAKQAKAVICYGSAAEVLFDEVARHTDRISAGPQVELAGDFDEAVRRARRLAAPGDVVVLSPACTSYDTFANYEERGERFCTLVRGPAG